MTAPGGFADFQRYYGQSLWSRPNDTCLVSPFLFAADRLHLFFPSRFVGLGNDDAIRAQIVEVCLICQAVQVGYFYFTWVCAFLFLISL